LILPNAYRPDVSSVGVALFLVMLLSIWLDVCFQMLAVAVNWSSGQLHGSWSARGTKVYILAPAAASSEHTALLCSS